MKSSFCCHNSPLVKFPNSTQNTQVPEAAYFLSHNITPKIESCSSGIGLVPLRIQKKIL